MNRFAVLFILMVSLTGCQSLGAGFVEGAEEKIRLKWAEEWKPALQAEITDSLTDARQELLTQVNNQLELQEVETRARLDSVNVRLEDFDKDADGKVTGTESAELVAALVAAKDSDGKPLNWYEILMAVILGYGGTTAGKEWIKSRMKVNGGSTQPA